ncbi:MAG TPA: flagellar motor protein [Bryobacteraceae bacterium]|nr:flagellar motor protein [Bryobacteraceae bacterium]
MSDKNNKASGGSAKPDLATIGGLVLAFAGILGGLLLDGGRITDVAQITAALIVLGGTIGAVMVTTPLHLLVSAVKKLTVLFFDRSPSFSNTIDQIIALATHARTKGIVSLDTEMDSIADPFLRKALMLAVDGADLQDLRSMMELDIQVFEQHGEAEARVFEAAGGYAPTIGIIGAVLGLIQVMKHLENIEEVGRGIAVAFVATVYGVASANLFFLPAGNKIKARLQRAVHLREMMLEGVCNIAEGLNPKLIRMRLETYLVGETAPKKKAPADKAPAAASRGMQAESSGA